MAIPYHGHMMNERYLHHHFSHQLQGVVPNPLDLGGTTEQIALHPEWPTYKQSIGRLNFGRYAKRNDNYFPVRDGKKGGFIDFALGNYSNPEIGIEFKLTFGWNREPLIFDYVKLLDRQNPFKKVVSFTVLMRKKAVAQGRDRENLQLAIAHAYEVARRRLTQAEDGDRLTPKRIQRFIISEIAPQGRIHRYSGELGQPFHVVGNLP
jgi:hypothetical protein